MNSKEYFWISRTSVLLNSTCDITRKNIQLESNALPSNRDFQEIYENILFVSQRAHAIVMDWLFLMTFSIFCHAPLRAGGAVQEEAESTDVDEKDVDVFLVASQCKRKMSESSQPFIGHLKLILQSSEIWLPRRNVVRFFSPRTRVAAVQDF